MSNRTVWRRIGKHLARGSVTGIAGWAAIVTTPPLMALRAQIDAVTRIPPILGAARRVAAEGAATCAGLAAVAVFGNPALRGKRMPRKAALLDMAAAVAGPALWAGLVPAIPPLRRAFLEPEPDGSAYIVTRRLFVRLLGVTYLVAFASLWPQLPGLIGKQGIAPAPGLLEAVKQRAGRQAYRRLPTLAWLDASDRALRGICGAGMVLSALLILGVAPVPVLILLWVGYLSLLSIGQEFLSFQWDVLLLETGFLSIFFAPVQLLPGRSRRAAPSTAVLWLLRLLVFRLMFFSGVVKLASQDLAWRELTAMTYHYETQPLPTPVAWYMHRLPRWFQSLSADFVFVTELGAPFLIFAPRRLRLAAAAQLIVLQLLIMLTGNYAFFNLLSIALCILLLDDMALRRVAPWLAVPAGAHAASRRTAVARSVIVAPVGLLILLLNAVQLADILREGRRVPRKVRALAEWLAPFHLVGRYGLFAVMTTSRPEIVVEGSRDGQTWLPYTFRYKPGDVDRRPRWVAPHQPRLDWQMWFAALGGPWNNRWLSNFLVRLLEGDEAVLDLLERNPFPASPPRYVRAMLYTYHFADVEAHRAEGAWWQRELQGLYFPPVSLQEA